MVNLTAQQAAFVAKYLGVDVRALTAKTLGSVQEKEVTSHPLPEPGPEHFLQEQKEQIEAAVSELIGAADKAEPAATSSLQELAGAHGGEMVGLEFRLKSQESLARKISDEAERSGDDIAEIAKRINDTLRYTTIFPDERYVDGVQASRKKLLSDGHSEIKFKNTWRNRKGYRGINAVYETAAGSRFELQFHTKTSHYAKEKGTHALYEEQRRLSPDSDRYRELARQQQEIFAALLSPPGAEELR